MPAKLNSLSRALPREILDYRERGWSIIPIAAGSKLPKGRWKQWRDRHASSESLRRWNAAGYQWGVVFGRPSGGLFSRDFDDLKRYEQWAEQQPLLARALPTVRTRRGMHVYGVAEPDEVVEIRRLHGKRQDAIGCLKYEDGELRPGEGCQSVVPPSKHPSGHQYEWIRPLPKSFPKVQLIGSGLCPTPPERGVVTHVVKRCVLACVLEPVFHNSDKPLVARIDDYISKTLPSRIGERSSRLFDYTRWLKSEPTLVDASADYCLEHVIRWHQKALPFIGTKDFEETWRDFSGQWEVILHPAGRGPLESLLAQVRSQPLPEAFAGFANRRVGELAALCRQLQLSTGVGEPFFLACRTVARLFDVSHTTGAKWLRTLVDALIITPVEAGTFKSMLATTYRMEN